MSEFQLYIVHSNYTLYSWDNAVMWFQAVFERLVDIICDKMSESLDSNPDMLSNAKGTRLTEQPQGPHSPNCNC